MRRTKQSTIPVEKSMAMRYAYQVEGFKGKKLLDMFKGYSKAVIYKHAKKPLNGELKVDKPIGSRKRRPSKLGRLDNQNITKAVHELRETEGSFTSKHLKVVSGFMFQIGRCDVK